MGATALMSGASTWTRERRRRPTVVSVDALPRACRMPVLEVELPGVMVSTFDPRAVISEVTWPCAPFAQPDGQDDGRDADEDPEHGQGPTAGDGCARR